MGSWGRSRGVKSRPLPMDCFAHERLERRFSFSDLIAFLLLLMIDYLRYCDCYTIVLNLSTQAKVLLQMQVKFGIL